MLRIIWHVHSISKLLPWRHFANVIATQAKWRQWRNQCFDLGAGLSGCLVSATWFWKLGRSWHGEGDAWCSSCCTFLCSDGTSSALLRWSWTCIQRSCSAICGIYNLSLILFCCSIPYVAKRSKVRMHHVDGLQLTARIGAPTPPFNYSSIYPSKSVWYCSIFASVPEYTVSVCVCVCACVCMHFCCSTWGWHLGCSLGAQCCHWEWHCSDRVCGQCCVCVCVCVCVCTCVQVCRCVCILSFPTWTHSAFRSIQAIAAQTKASQFHFHQSECCMEVNKWGENGVLYS